MTHEWVIDVLEDIQRFAQLNQMPLLAEQLNDTIEVAREESTSCAVSRGVSLTNQNEQSQGSFSD